MKKIIIVAFLIFVLTSCASEKAYKNYSDASKEMAKNYYKAAEKPLLDLTLPAPDGKEYHLVVNREVKVVELAQIKDSEWVAPFQSLVSTTGLVAGSAVIVAGAGSKTQTVGRDQVSGSEAQHNTPTTTTTETIINGVTP